MYAQLASIKGCWRNPILISACLVALFSLAGCGGEQAAPPVVTSVAVPTLSATPVPPELTSTPTAVVAEPTETRAMLPSPLPTAEATSIPVPIDIPTPTPVPTLSPVSSPSPASAPSETPEPPEAPQPAAMSTPTATPEPSPTPAACVQSNPRAVSDPCRHPDSSTDNGCSNLRS